MKEWGNCGSAIDIIDSYDGELIYECHHCGNIQDEDGVILNDDYSV